MRFFISCSHKQGDVARKLIKGMGAHGHEAIAMNLNTILGDNIFDTKKLISYTGGFDYVLLILSKDYVKDEWLKKESYTLKLYETNFTEGEVILPIIFDDCETPDFLKNNTQFEYEDNALSLMVDKIIDFTTQRKQAFIIMKFNDDSLEMAYKEGIEKALAETGYTKLRIDDYKDGEKISPRILKEIKKSDVIIADLTGERPNCYYEVGYAHALGKKVILSARQNTNLHFDLHDHNFIFWNSPLELRSKLIEALNFIPKPIRNSK